MKDLINACVYYLVLMKCQLIEAFSWYFGLKRNWSIKLWAAINRLSIIINYWKGNCLLYQLNNKYSLIENVFGMTRKLNPISEQWFYQHTLIEKGKCKFRRRLKSIINNADCLNFPIVHRSLFIGIWLAHQVLSIKDD